MLSTRFLVHSLAFALARGQSPESSATPAAPGTASVVTRTPPPTITNPAPPECTGDGLSIMMPQEATGELHTALDSASITYGLVPSVPCSELAVLPSTLQDDFAEFETRWYSWWMTQRIMFTRWASSCTGQFTGPFAEIASEYFEATSSMDEFRPRVTDCADFTGSGIEASATGGTASGNPTASDADGAASETGAAGQSGGSSFRLQHSAALCVIVAMASNIFLII